MKTNISTKYIILAALILIIALGVYFIFSKSNHSPPSPGDFPSRDGFNRSFNQTLDSEKLAETTNIFAKADSESINNYCNENMPYCMNYCRENQDNSFCSEIQNIAPRGARP